MRYRNDMLLIEKVFVAFGWLCLGALGVVLFALLVLYPLLIL